jgi:aspartate-semialdehyde dehydrogenase
MTILEAQQYVATAQAQIQKILQNLETQTGLAVHSVPVTHGKTVAVQIKMQLP